MKKTILTPVIAVFILLFTQVSVVAQANNGKQDLTDSKNLLAISKMDLPGLYDGASATSASEVNTKAMRDFKKTFKNVEDEKWYTISNGFVAEFTKQAVRNSVVYDKKGNWVFTICYYDEKSLPTEVRSLVKKTYYDYAITTVEEIHVDEKIIYLVHLQNETTWKKLRVCDGEMQVLEDFNKQ